MRNDESHLDEFHTQVFSGLVKDGGIERERLETNKMKTYRSSNGLEYNLVGLKSDEWDSSVAHSTLVEFH